MATSCRQRVNDRIDILKSQGKWTEALRGSKSVRDLPRETVLPKVGKNVRGKPVKIPRPIVGYTGFDRMVAAGNVHATDYQKAWDQGLKKVGKNYKSIRASQGEAVSATSSQTKQPYSKHHNYIRPFI